MAPKPEYEEQLQQLTFMTFFNGGTWECSVDMPKGSIICTALYPSTAVMLAEAQARVALSKKRKGKKKP